jgi:hypothetical protein
MNRRWRSGMMVVAALGAGAWAGPRALAAEWEACAMLQKADLDAAFAPKVFDPGTSGREKVAGTARLAAVSSCTFTSKGASARDRLTVTLVARRAPSDDTGVTPAAARAGAVQLKASPVEVAGLGDGAYWVNLGSAAFPMLELNVFRGKRVWLVFGAAGRKLDVAIAVAALTRVARASAARE